MTAGASENFACVLCGETKSHLLWRSVDHHYGNPGQWNVLQCADCGLGFLSPMPCEAELASYYPASYPPHLNFSAPGRWRQALSRLLFSDVSPRDPAFPQPGRLLDLGCGTGTFLLAAKRRGWKVTGVEPAAAPAHFARGKGLEIFCGSLCDAAFPDAGFDYIRLIHTFEHLLDPCRILREIRRILKPSGTLFIAVPNCESATARFWGENWWYIGAPVHTYHYSGRTLPRILAQAGFETTRITYNSSYEGVLGSLQIFLNRGKPGIPSAGILPRSRLFMVPGNWLARLIQFFGTGDVVEIVARPSSQAGPV